MRVVLPDLGCGNFASVVRMAEEVGGGCELVTDPKELASADKIILAGVGAFDHAMSNLRSGGWFEPLNEAVLGRRVPVLGICLGMQLMCDGSEEGSQRGLGWMQASVRRFSFSEPGELKIPHMGWNTVAVQRANTLFPSDEPEIRFYFTHSFHVVCSEPQDVIATTHYGYDFASGFSRGNIFGVQFHPEKSHRFGKALMKKFLQL